MYEAVEALLGNPEVSGKWGDCSSVVQTKSEAEPYNFSWPKEQN